MLDTHMIMETPGILKETLLKRKMDPSLLSNLEALIEKKKSVQAQVEELRRERNRVSKELGFKKSKGEDISQASLEMKEVGYKIKELEGELQNFESELNDLNLGLPNLLDPSVPEGSSEADNQELFTQGEKRKFSYEPKPHFEIGEKLGIFDFERGVKLSGSRAYTYFGLGSRMERALMNFMLDVHRKDHGYEEVWVPLLVNDDSMMTTGQYPKFKDEYYRLEKDNLNLIPTAEVSLTNLYRDEILKEEFLTRSVMAHTSCFRREAGSYGRDTKGLVRVHQFQKVELVKFTRPEDSEAEHEKMLKNAERILQLLDLPYRVMLLCSVDTSNSSSKTYDIEVWMPGLNRYMEISSVSNFKDYQSRRGKIRYKNKEGKNVLVHTINGSGLAIGRTLAAVIENYQTEDGNFEIPEVLKPYLAL